MLRWMAFLPFFFAVFFRFALPWVRDLILARFDFDLEPYYIVVMSYGFVIGIPVIFGLVLGFLLLDERDDGTLIALQVTPLTTNSYLAYRVSIPMIISVILTVITFPLAGLSDLPLWQVFVVSLLAAPMAPIFALVLAALAENKVQGFALMKGLGMVLVLPLFAFFIDSWWQIIFGLIPTYWPLKVFWMFSLDEPGVWVYALVGLLYALLILAVLMRRFNRILHR